MKRSETPKRRFAVGQRVKIKGNVPVVVGGILWRGMVGTCLKHDCGLVTVKLPDGQLVQYQTRFIEAA